MNLLSAVCMVLNINSSLLHMHFVYIVINVVLCRSVLQQRTDIAVHYSISWMLYEDTNVLASFKALICHSTLYPRRSTVMLFMVLPDFALPCLYLFAMLSILACFWTLNIWKPCLYLFLLLSSVYLNCVLCCLLDYWAYMKGIIFNIQVIPKYASAYTTPTWQNVLPYQGHNKNLHGLTMGIWTPCCISQPQQQAKSKDCTLQP